MFTVARRDVKLLGKRPKADTETHAVMMRPELAQYATWEREAKRRGLAVSTLAMQLLDEVSGWRGDPRPANAARCCTGATRGSRYDRSMSDDPTSALVVAVANSKATEALVKEAAQGVAGFFLPRKIVKIARAEAEAATIHTEAEAKASITRAEAEIAVEGLRRRAEYRRREEDLLHQLNLEQIAAQAQPLLADGATTDQVDDDWLANLRDKARLISNEQMQSLWARVLAGEINRPGTFSRRTVNAIADLDRVDCAAFTALCHFCWQIDGITAPLILD